MIIAVIVRAVCLVCSRTVDGRAPPGARGIARPEECELPEPGWQMVATHITDPDTDEPSRYVHTCRCSAHRERFGQDFPSTKPAIAQGG